MEIILVLSVAALVIALAALYLAVDAGKRAQKALNRAETANCFVSEYSKIREEIREVRQLIPEDVVEERQRRNVLMRDLNDEMERRIKAEEAWNKMVEGVLGYDIGVARRGGENRDG